MQEEEYTTALPTFSANPAKEKERKERGLRGVLPFQRKKKDKDRDKDKEKERDREKAKDKESRKDKDRMAEQHDKESRGRSAMGDAPATSVMGSLRGRPERERDEEF
jgi:hypothetical protein